MPPWPWACCWPSKKFRKGPLTDAEHPRGIAPGVLCIFVPLYPGSVPGVSRPVPGPSAEVLQPDAAVHHHGPGIGQLQVVAQLHGGQLLADVLHRHAELPGHLLIPALHVLIRELDHVKAQSYDVEYPELTALHLFPQSSEADPGAETITYYTYDKTGLAKIIDNYSTDLPRADVTGKPSFAKIKSIGDSYGYSAQEMRASRLAGKSLDARKGESARYQIDALTNKIAWCGDEESGLMGVLSDGQNIPLYTIGANASGKTKWAEKSADEILADVNGMAKQVAKITKNVERPDTLCVPADVFMDISTRRIPDTSTTVLAFIQEHAPYIKNVVSTAELDADSPETNPYATGGNPQGVAFLFKNDPRKLTLENPMPFYQYPLQVEKLETIILCEARTAGVIVYYPLSALIAVGVS